LNLCVKFKLITQIIFFLIFNIQFYISLILYIKDKTLVSHVIFCNDWIVNFSNYQYDLIAHEFKRLDGKIETKVGVVEKTIEKRNEAIDEIKEDCL